jgi:HSP20 family molecular chaperone IbpA
MTGLARRQSPARFPDLFDWLESPWASLLPFIPAHTVRIEDYTDDGRYVIRAELPGLDPEKDVEVTVEAGVLTIHAERREEKNQAHRSEFRYGSLTRSVTLPPGADTEKITASYDQGILEVSVRIPEHAKPKTRHIAIKRAD